MSLPGGEATSPWRMPWAAWRQVLARVWHELGADNASLVAAGVAFYGFLSIVPAIAALVLLYGLFASPLTLAETMIGVARHLPAEAIPVVFDQIKAVAQAPESAKGWGLAAAIALAVYGATKGVDALVSAINIAYEEEETRGFVKRSVLILAMTVALTLLTLAALTTVSLVHLPMSDGANGFLSVFAYLPLGGFGVAAAALLYRFAPDRAPAKARWLTPGGLVTALLWTIITSGFGAYTAAVGDFGATYGSLAGVVALLTWLYFSAYALIVGAELNAELELQTARDTTTGAERPMGERRAEVADHIATDRP
jgi:membrane protein